MTTGRLAVRGGVAGRDVVSVLALALCALTTLLAVVGAHGPVRGLAALAFVLVVPGWSAVVWLDLRSPALEASLTLGVGLAAETLVSVAMISARDWHPLAAQGIFAVVAVCSLVIHLAEPPRQAPERAP